MHGISSNFTAHLLILALSIGATLSVRTALQPQYSQERRRIEGTARTKRVQQIAAAWNTLRYTDISTPDLPETFFARLDLQKVQLTPPQQERLRVRLREIFEYLRNHTFESYLELKTNGLHYTFTPSRTSELSSPEANLISTTYPESDVKASVEDVWNSLRTKKSPLPMGRLTAICLDRVRIAVTHTNSPGSIFNGPVAQGFTIARSSVNPGFSYEGLSDETGGWLSGGPFLLVSFPARSASLSNSGPVYISLWWSEMDQDWAPNRLFTDGLLNMAIFF